MYSIFNELKILLIKKITLLGGGIHLRLSPELGEFKIHLKTASTNSGMIRRFYITYLLELLLNDEDLINE